MSGTTLQREQAGEPPQTLRPAPFLIDALVALLEGDAGRMVKVSDKLYLRASAFVPALCEALDHVATYNEPQSISACALARLQLYTTA
jgi:hypothetical protein